MLVNTYTDEIGKNSKKKKYVWKCITSRSFKNLKTAAGTPCFLKTAMIGYL